MHRCIGPKVVEPLRRGVLPSLRTMGAELERVGLGAVRGMGGLSDAEITALEATCPGWPPQLLAVSRREEECA